jgi:hypothetical protein
VADGATADVGPVEGLQDDGETRRTQTRRTQTRSTQWRGIEALGEAVGGYCWLEGGIFELTGTWATATGDEALAPEMRVFSAAVSRRHGVLAERWAARLPVRAGVDPAALVVPPPGLPWEVAAPLSETTPGEVAGAGRRLGPLLDVLLPWLAGEYGAHLAVASPVNEAPVMEVLVEARRTALAEVRGGRRLLARLDAAGSKGGGLISP